MRLRTLCPFAVLALAACKSADAPPSTGAATLDLPANAPAAAVSAAPEAAPSKAEVGKPAPPFRLTDTDGRSVDLASLRGKTVVLEWFNPDCPFVRLNHTKGPLKDMAKKKVAEGVVWLSVNSSAPGKQGNGVERNREAKKTYGIENPVLLDESGEVGQRYGAKTTPHVFVVDKQGTLVYAGAIDNAQDGEPPGGQPFVNYVDSALQDIAAGRPVSTPSVPSYGCSVKYAH
jgi:peroxiredoxin